MVLAIMFALSVGFIAITILPVSVGVEEVWQVEYCFIVIEQTCFVGLDIPLGAVLVAQVSGGWPLDSVNSFICCRLRILREELVSRDTQLTRWVEQEGLRQAS